jgi:hypothetical protein
MPHATQNLSSGSKTNLGGVRLLWRQGFLFHSNDQTIRFMQHVRRKLGLLLVRVGSGSTASFLRSETSADFSQPEILNPGVVR